MAPSESPFVVRAGKGGEAIGPEGIPDGAVSTRVAGPGLPAPTDTGTECF